MSLYQILSFRIFFLFLIVVINGSLSDKWKEVIVIVVDLGNS